MTDRPMGIEDVIVLRERFSPPYQEHWYWCRRHQRAEHVNEPPVTEDQSYPAAAAIDPGCIRIGPFMTESEASRLDGSGCGDIAGGCPSLSPLGMEVEE